MKYSIKFAFWGLAAIVLGSAVAGAAATKNKAHDQAFAPNRPMMEKALGAQDNTARWWNSQGMIDRLKLTDDQRKAMDQILFDHRAKLIDLHAALQKAELGMQELMNAEQPDQKAMQLQIDKVVAARSDLERANSRFLLDIRMKLTTDQWKQLRQGHKLIGQPASPKPPAQPQFRNRRNMPAPAPPAPPAGPGAAPQSGGNGIEQ